jgi:hypothetical protein
METLMNLLPAEELAFTTARIEAVLHDGHTSIGTAFFFSFPLPNGTQIPILVTNKHVVEGAIWLTFHMTRQSQSGEPVIGDFIKVQISNIPSPIIDHPDTAVDLCAIPLGPLLNQAQSQGEQFFYRHLEPQHLADPNELADLVALEDVIMIGYPNGLWDSVNNMPVFRRGVTATHPYIDYEGRKEFLIDLACFPGSSGSPVLLYNMNGYKTRNGTWHLAATRIKLLGILYAGPQFNAEGELQLVPVPTSVKAITLSRIPINVGVVIKAERILELEPLLQNLLISQGGT